MKYLCGEACSDTSPLLTITVVAEVSLGNIEAGVTLSDDPRTRSKSHLLIRSSASSYAVTGSPKKTMSGLIYPPHFWQITTGEELLDAILSHHQL